MKSCEADFWAKCAALGSRPRSPMMTVSGIAAKGLSPDFLIRRIAAESVSPQLLAVLGSDTELRFAVVPVISLCDLICGYKGIKKSLIPIHLKSEILLNDQRFFWPLLHMSRTFKNALKFSPYFLHGLPQNSLSIIFTQPLNP